MKSSSKQRKSFKERQKELKLFYLKHYGIMGLYLLILAIFIYVNL